MVTFSRLFPIHVILIFNYCTNCLEGTIIETPDMTSEDDVVSTEKWGPMRNCPLGTVVTGFKLNFLSSKIQNSHALQGVALQCSKLNYFNNYQQVQIIFDGLVNPHQPWTYSTNNYAVGFTFETWRQLGGQKFRGHWKFRFADEPLPISFPRDSFEQHREEVTCPGSDSYAICGFQALRNEQLTIKKLRFHCCYHCVPKEVQVVVYDFTNNGITDVHHTVTKRIGMTGGQTASESDTFVKKKAANPGGEAETGNALTGVVSPPITSPAGGAGGSNSAGRELKLTPNKSQHQTIPTSFPSPHETSNMPQGPPIHRESRFRRTPPKLNRVREGHKMASARTMPEGPPGHFELEDLGREGPPSGGGTPPSPPSGGPPAIPGASSGGSSGGSQSPPSAPGAGSGAGAGTGSGGGSGSSNFNLKAKFSAKFGLSKSTAFNWGTASWSNWMHNMDETDTIVCKALHRCVMKQLTGMCGIYQFHTPQFDFTHIPIRPDLFPDPLSFSSPAPPSLANTMKTNPGEFWILARLFKSLKTITFWERPKHCPPGTVVTGQQMKLNGRRQVTGLNLECSRLNASSKFETVAMMSSGRGMPQQWAKGMSEAIGYRVGYGPQNSQLLFQQDESGELPRDQMNEEGLVMCPPKHAVCGMQAMYDTEGGGQILHMGLQCCYHCDPQEKIIVLESFTNLGYTDTIQTVTRLIGNVRNSSFSHAGNNLTEAVSLINGINPSGLQAGFAAKFDRKSDSGFNWLATSNAFWQASEQKTLTVLCKARMLCVMRQLIGLCNDLEIPTPFTIKESFPLDLPHPDNQGPGLRIKRSDEIWIVAKNLTFATKSDIWDGPLLCPSGTFVTAQQLTKNSRYQLGGLSLRCSRLNKQDKFVSVAVLTSGFGNKTHWYDAQSPAIGFSYLEYQFKNTFWKAKWELRFENDRIYHQAPIGAKNVTRNQVTCPQGHAITGMQTMFDMEHKGQLTNIGFRCSLYCRPEEKLVLLNAFTNGGNGDTVQMVKVTVGTRKMSTKSMVLNPLDQIRSEMTLKTGPINPINMQNMFAFKFPKSVQYDGFNWEDTSVTMWTTVTDKMMKVLCRAEHLCTMKQLVGFCGKFEILSPHIIQNIIPLNNSVEVNYFPVHPSYDKDMTSELSSLENFMTAANL